MKDPIVYSPNPVVHAKLHPRSPRSNFSQNLGPPQDPQTYDEHTTQFITTLVGQRLTLRGRSVLPAAITEQPVRFYAAIQVRMIVRPRPDRLKWLRLPIGRIRSTTDSTHKNPNRPRRQYYLWVSPQ